MNSVHPATVTIRIIPRTSTALSSGAVGISGPRITRPSTPTIATPPPPPPPPSTTATTPTTKTPTATITPPPPPPPPTTTQPQSHVTQFSTPGLIANAGPDQTVHSGDTITLDGSASKGAGLTYNWNSPSNFLTTSTLPSTAKVTFTAPQVTTKTVYTFKLFVVDNEARLATDTVDITVEPTAVIPPSTPPSSPVT